MTLLQRDRENIELGRSQMASLITILLSENRTDELNRALEDSDFRNRLFEEYAFYNSRHISRRGMHNSLGPVLTGPF